MDAEGVYRERFKPLYRYFYYKNIRVADIDDLVQDTFLRFFERYDTTTLTADDCAKLLYGFARNIYLEWVRAHATHSVVELNDDFPDSSSEEEYEAEQKPLSLEVRGALLTAIHSLNPTLRQVITMRFLEGKTRREVALALDIEPKHVHVYQRRAIAALEKLLAEKLYPPGHKLSEGKHAPTRRVHRAGAPSTRPRAALGRRP
jgi:RNA polymerase sigma factor (sigma-70 family)